MAGLFAQAVLLLACLCSVDCYSILMLASDVPSHVIQMGRLGSQLISRGHDITMSFSSRLHVPDVLDPRIHVETFTHVNAPFPENEHVQALNHGVIFRNSIFNLLKFVYYYPGYLVQPGYDLLSDGRLRNRTWDHVIVDGITPSYMLYPYIKNIPYSVVTYSCSMDRGLLPHPAYVPHPLLGYSQDMNLLQRCINAAVGIAAEMGAYLYQAPAKLFPPNVQATDYGSLLTQADLCLTIRTNILDFLRPVSADSVSLAPIMARPAGRLATQDQELLDASNGTVLVSFGSSVPIIPEHILARLLWALGQLPHTVLFRYPHQISNVPGNVEVRFWLAQNDLLGHPSVRLFVTHGGYNSLIETVYHGVPVVVFPLMIDQTGNAQLMKVKGLGEVIDIVQDSRDVMLTAFRKVIEDTTYKAKVTSLSRMFREVARIEGHLPVVWIEHVIRYGAKHLKSSGVTLPWYKFFLLDLLAIFVISCLISYKLFKCLHRTMTEIVYSKIFHDT